MSPFSRPAEDTIITALPLYHIFSLTANCLTFMKVGGHNILITNPRDMPGFVKELGKIKFTVTVSYTHLDVYKRQSLPGVGLPRMRWKFSQ